VNLKLSTLALAAFALAGTAQAAIFTGTGDTTGAPTYNRALIDFSALSGVGTSVPYDVLDFTVDVSGNYTFLTTAAFDSFAYLYSPSFDPTAALSNGLAANDDLLPGFTTSGFAFGLTAGTSYQYVVTGFSNAEFGSFSTTIGGPGIVTVVPEPETYALLMLGLGVVGLAARRRQRAIEA
jgi:hypothetical protein